MNDPFGSNGIGLGKAQVAYGASVSATTRDTGLSRQTVYRIQEDPAEAEAILARRAA